MAKDANYFPAGVSLPDAPDSDGYYRVQYPLPPAAAALSDDDPVDEDPISEPANTGTDEGDDDPEPDDLEEQDPDNTIDPAE